MPSKPSRSEIEKSVAGQNARKRKHRRNEQASVEGQLDTLTARKRQVIGGDLTGISRRSRTRSKWTDYREYNAANWIAGGIVISILAVFFWPQAENSVKEISNSQTENAISAYENESRVVENEAVEVPSSFSRDDDIQRATVFREADEKEIQIRELMRLAKAHLDNNEYSLPSGGNAVLRYHQILQIDSRNVDAKQGLEFVRTRFLNDGLRDLSQNRVTSAEKNLATLARIDKQSAEHDELRVSITAWQKDRQINQLLNKANQAIKKDQVILPARQNALYFYQQVQELDNENIAAKNGIQRISDSFIDKANQAILRGDFQAATGFLATVSVISPDHPSIPLIEAVITKAKPIAEKSENNQKLTTAKPPAAEPSSSNWRNTDDKKESTQRITRNQDSARRNASNSRTPTKEAKEQETIDRQYLELGLNAYYKGEYQTAVSLLKPLADKGVSRAQMRIGYMAYLGRGYKKNKTEADRIIRAALPAVQEFADQGRAWAQSDIGSLYEDGLVLPRDFGEAVYWYRSAAEQGYPGAQTNLGIMYARGKGVGTSRKTAIEWFQRAAKQGDISAQRNLESLGVKF